jgi:hypothetical protein
METVAPTKEGRRPGSHLIDPHRMTGVETLTQDRNPAAAYPTR